MPELNPYAAPRAAGDAPFLPRTERHVVGAWSVALHCALISPIVGALLVTFNYGRVADGRSLARAFGRYVVPAALLLVLSIVALGTGYTMLVFCFQVVFAWLVLRDQRELVRRHVAAGGRVARWWVTPLVTLPSLLFVLAVWQFLSPAGR